MLLRKEGVELYRQLDGIAFGRPAAGREKILRWRGGGPNKRYRQKKTYFRIREYYFMIILRRRRGRVLTVYLNTVCGMHIHK
jgi:hypothetical protein